MADSFTVTPYPERNLIHFTLAGFFDAERLAAFQATRLAAFGRLPRGCGAHDTLVDVRDFRLQAQDIVEAFRAMIDDPALRSRRLAFVTGDAAVRMQIRRVVERDEVRCFADLPTAEAWLAEPSEDRTPMA